MVRIVSKEIEGSWERHNRLLYLARQVVETKYQESSIGAEGIRIDIKGVESQIEILSENFSNVITIEDPKLFPYAVKIASAFEANGEPEFTVKKNYK